MGTRETRERMGLFFFWGGVVGEELALSCDLAIIRECSLGKGGGHLGGLSG